MKSGKLIDISKSSLISLKAELARKQEEAKKIKGDESYVKLTPKPKPLPKVNPGVEERNIKDQELTSEEVDLLKKSKEVLEIKASLYEKLQSGALISEDGKERYLVDFGRKSPPPQPSRSIDKIDPTLNADYSKFASDPEKNRENTYNADENKRDSMPVGPSYKFVDEDWVEYTDCLGRTRKCHKSDLESMQDRDRVLAKTLHKEQAANILSNPNITEEELAEKEMISHDMHLELLRKKWEEKERELLEKDKVHYEDILFDEARSHGVGYWKFSTDPEKREAEQEMLRKVRSETEKRQKEAKALRDRREHQRQARLIAARQRQRARLGLPPIEFTEQPQEEIEEEPVEEIKESLEIKLQKAAHVRPWDVGKDGVQNPPMSQAEWVAKKRSERPKEFAPVYVEDTESRHKKFDISSIPLPDEPLPEESNPLQSRTKNFLKKRKEKEEALKAEKKGAEIPPPMDFDYHTPNVNQRKHTTSIDHKSTAEAIDAGLRLLREQFERDQKATPKGTL
ncbi:coiled-coil domain-containing protein 174 [Cimex lectularius]|uniref:CCDC174 alpha/beta GRSR domain-containing protein n=1 Tax=Cimex lectularius TaxID=79782 RepID=A0A8I6S5U2_CIMLE|nr:coiled-coil domain-containing protein 174 [Cimex lectularius]